MTTATLTAALGAMTRAQIAQWLAEQGIPLLHLSHYAKRHLIGYAVEQWRYQQQKGA